MNQSSVVEQNPLKFWLELGIKVCLVFLEAVVSFNLSSRLDDANIEGIDMGQQFVVYSFLELGEILGGPQIVESWKTSVLDIEKAFFDDKLIVFGYIDVS